MILLHPQARASIDEGPPPTRELTGEEICDALAAGKVWAADAFYDRVENTVEAVLFCMLGATDIDRDKLMRQALERLIAGAMAGRLPGRCSFKAWVAMVTQQVALEALRARVRKHAVIDRSLAPGTTLIATVTDSASGHALEVRRRLDALLGALGQAKPAHAEAVVLHDLLGYELAEICSLTGVSMARAQARLQRGRHDVGSLIESSAAKPAR